MPPVLVKSNWMSEQNKQNLFVYDVWRVTTYSELKQIECRVFHTTPTPIVAHSQQSIFETCSTWWCRYDSKTRKMPHSIGRFHWWHATTPNDSVCVFYFRFQNFCFCFRVISSDQNFNWGKSGFGCKINCARTKARSTSVVLCCVAK